MTDQERLEIIRTERAEFGTPLGRNALAVCRRVARAFNRREHERAGLLKKPHGHNIDGYAQDIICYPDGQHFDILGDGENLGEPRWDFVGMVDPARYEEVVIEPEPEPRPEPQPRPDPGQDPELEAVVALISARVIAGLSPTLEAIQTLAFQAAGNGSVAAGYAARGLDQLDRGFEARILGSRVAITPKK